MRLAVVGSRQYPDKAQVLAFMDTVPRDWVIVSGGCPNSPDQWSVDYAKANGMAYIEYPADWNGPYGKGAGFARNTIIAQECDYLVCFDSGSRGCMDTYRKAYNLGRPVRLVTSIDKL